MVCFSLIIPRLLPHQQRERLQNAGRTTQTENSTSVGVRPEPSSGTTLVLRLLHAAWVDTATVIATATFDAVTVVLLNYCCCMESLYAKNQTHTIPASPRTALRVSARNRPVGTLPTTPAVQQALASSPSCARR